MARKTHPRSADHHRVIASAVLDRHARETKQPITLPVPIELIIEKTYGITIEWDDIDEPAEAKIVGALLPAENRIVLNTKHQEMFENWMGPERFTLAHELAHWVYDADDSNQMALDLSGSSPTKFCYARGGTLPEASALREVNANKLAAHLLLPEHLIRATDIDWVVKNIGRAAYTFGVSRRTLEIRLEELGLAGETDDDLTLL